MSIEYTYSNTNYIRRIKPDVAISQEQAQKLREKTNVGLMECKYALSINGGDEEKALAYLRSRRIPMGFK